MVGKVPAPVTRSPDQRPVSRFAHINSLIRRSLERRIPHHFSPGKSALRMKFAYDERIMESMRKHTKLITWFLIGTLVLGTGAGLISGLA